VRIIAIKPEEDDEPEDILIIQRDRGTGRGFVTVHEGPFSATYRRYYNLKDKFATGVIKVGGIRLLDRGGKIREFYPPNHIEPWPRKNTARRWGRH
jgi:hypothetical protein